MNKNKLFNSVVENALDFLKKSINEFETDPKHSVINFHSATELFLKSRLVLEHWTLVVSKKQEPDFDKFNNGDFQSVTIIESIERLKNILKFTIADEFRESLNTLTKHRNKMTHFFHEEYDTNNLKLINQSIAREQLIVWYHLNNLLQTSWNQYYKDWKEKFEEIDKLLKRQREYLKIIFNKFTEGKKNLEVKGLTFSKCNSCKFKSFGYIFSINKIISGNCHVCDLSEEFLYIICDQCNSKVKFINEGFGSCQTCSKIYEPEKIAEIIYSTNEERDDFGYQNLPGNCGDCDGNETVVKSSDKTFFCTSCFTVSEEIFSCGWCNSSTTENLESSSIFGCSQCNAFSRFDSI